MRARPGQIVSFCVGEKSLGSRLSEYQAVPRVILFGYGGIELKNCARQNGSDMDFPITHAGPLESIEKSLRLEKATGRFKNDEVSLLR